MRPMTDRERVRIENKARAKARRVFIEGLRKYGVTRADALRSWEQRPDRRRSLEKSWYEYYERQPGIFRASFNTIIGYFALPEDMSFEYNQRQRPGPTGVVVWMAGVALHCILSLTMVFVALAFVVLSVSVVAQIVWWLLTGERLLLI